MKEFEAHIKLKSGMEIKVKKFAKILNDAHEELSKLGDVFLIYDTDPKYKEIVSQFVTRHS